MDNQEEKILTEGETTEEAVDSAECNNEKEKNESDGDESPKSDNGAENIGFFKRNLYKILIIFAALVLVGVVVLLFLPREHIHTPSREVREDVVSASCTEDGSYTRILYCEDCGEEVSRVKIRELALDHIGGEVTCTDGAVCTRCGVEYKPERGHINTESSCINETECFFCCAYFVGAHDYSEADCTSPKICKSCSLTDGEALGHSFVLGDVVAGERTDECSRCKATRTVKIDE